MIKTRDVKWIMFTGLLIRLLGVGIMIHSRGANGTAAELVITQILQGIGGGFAATAIQVSAQAGVTHAQVATVTAMVLLITEVGNSVGSASELFLPLVSISALRLSYGHGFCLPNGN